MRLARVSVGSLCDFALQSSTGEWVPFASVGVDAATTSEAIDEIRSVRARVAAGRGEPVHEDAQLACPIVAPTKMLAIGLNYMDHIRETNAKQPASPVVFAKYPGRFPLVHVKDMSADGKMVDVGRGRIPFARIFAQQKAAGIRHYFVEHDEPADAFASIAASYAYLRGLRF